MVSYCRGTRGNPPQGGPWPLTFEALIKFLIRQAMLRKKQLVHACAHMCFRQQCILNHQFGFAQDLCLPSRKRLATFPRNVGPSAHIHGHGPLGCASLASDPTNRKVNFDPICTYGLGLSLVPKVHKRQSAFHVALQPDLFWHGSRDFLRSLSHSI